jgi:SNF2 family DNA or RNA helicase
MELNGYWYLIHDKLSQSNGKIDNSYTNKNTVNYSINEILSMENSIELRNAEAYTKYTELKISPSLENIDKNLYSIIMILSGNNVFTLIGINYKIFKKYLDNHETLPNEEFIKIVCKNHLMFNRASSMGYLYNKSLVDTSKSLYGKITQTIMDKVGDVTDPMIEPPKFLVNKFNLYNYQKRTIKWMLDRETYPSVTFNMEEEVPIGDYIYNSFAGDFIKSDSNKLTFNGGILIDEVGLGKTIQNIVLSLLNQPKKVETVNKDLNKFNSKATLILCPSQLCGQWKREIESKISIPVKIISLLTKTHFDKYKVHEYLDADFVIVSFSFLENKVFLDQFFGDLYKPRNRNTYDNTYIMKLQTENLCNKLIENCDTTLDNPHVFLFSINFNRLIIDELHEVFTIEKYLYIKNMLSLFTANYKWGITGTPFNDVMSLIHYIDYLTNYTNTHGTKIFQNNTIKNYITTNVFRRNTKKSVVSEYELPPLKESIVWLKFTHTERMMYNAYLANPNNNKDSDFLRKLCCHPKLSEELKYVLSSCKTLADIEKIMVEHYKSIMDASYEKLLYIKYRIKLSNRKIKVMELYRQKRILKNMGYKAVIDKDYLTFVTDEEDKLFIERKWNPFPTKDDNLVDIIDMLDDDEPVGKNTIIISKQNQDKVMKMIGNKFDVNTMKTYTNILESIQQYNMQLTEQQKDYDGKKTTFEFYNNVMDRIKKTQAKEYTEDDEQNQCGICFGEISEDNIGVTKCGHMFCYECICTVTEKQKKCPYCNMALRNGEIFMISYEKKNNGNKLCDKTQLINEIGTKLSNMIYYLKQTKDHVIIFSQWDDLLRKVGEVLNTYGVKNIFCHGNIFQRDKAIRTFNTDDSIKVIMLSSESAASGTNLTKATKVILLDPIRGSYEFRKNMEGQAIGRAHRMGQTKQVEVVRFIVKNTIEEDIYNENKQEDSKHNINKIVFESSDDSITLSDDKTNELAKAKEETLEKKKTVTVKKRVVRKKKNSDDD